MENGATSVVALATHGLFSGDAPERISASSIEKLIVTDTVNVTDEKRFNKLEVISVAGLFADAIANIHSGESVSALFNI